MKFLLLIILPVFAQDIIDLGSLEVEGEVRRPMVEFVETKNVVSKTIREITRKQIDNSEFYFDDFDKSEDKTKEIGDNLRQYENKVLESL